MMAMVCGNCGARFPPEVAAVFFVLNRRRSGGSNPDHKPICVGCEQTARDERTRRRWALTLAGDTINAYARRYGLGREAFEARYGWRAARLAHDIGHAFHNTCTYCWKPYAEMEQGLADVTVDVADPRFEPYYATNTRLCCRSCSTERAQLAPEQWALKLSGWRIWRRQEDYNEAGFVPMQLGFIYELEKAMPAEGPPAARRDLA